ncbi:heavy metal translocating P-type ATPase [Bavariicoccus seileri]|uniref:heavy metal translocating P-type ATPase n=1 Tax=Bavariicoccus seileri TaxID=549685 RepID=UPI0003B4B74E|nr:heavy metal translocating P-type ATPase [Bavariicoccus seileri]
MSNFKKFIITVTVGIVALIAEFGFKQPKIAFWLILLIGGITTISMFIGMIKTLKSGKYGVDILAITAIVATLAVGQYWASLTVLIMLTGGDSLEDYASRQAGKELKALLDNTPTTAHLLSDDTVTDVKVETVKIGDRILVKPGEVIPVDATVEKGSSFVDESSLTGESKPVDKTVGDELMSGSLNGDAALTVKVYKEAKDSQYQLLVKLVKESAARPAKFVRLADRYAVPFTLVAYLIGGVAWFLSKDPVRFAEVMVVASPCPLILAAPVALVAGMSRSSRHGIVVKTGMTIEKLAKAQTIAFDKTGTITAGRLFVDRVEIADSAYDRHTVIQLAASAEQASTHILSRSLIADAKKEKIKLLPSEDLEEVTGQGIKATVDGKSVKVGKAGFAHTESHLSSDETAVFVSVDDQFIGMITFKDVVRKETPETINKLKALGIDNISLITGDKNSIAQTIAKQVGITNVHSECLPEDKIAILKNVNDSERPVIMVGDGVNDAPALSIADVGIAMGAHGSTAASESADAVILRDDLGRVAEAVNISQNTMKIAKQSVLIGIFICVFLMLVASFGVIPALLGAALQEVIDTVSILSALRAKNDR